MKQIMVENEADVSQVLEITAKLFEITVANMISWVKTYEFSIPRHLVVWFLCNYSIYPTEKIAHFVGRSDHATANHSKNLVNATLIKNEIIQKRINDIKNIYSDYKYSDFSVFYNFEKAWE